MPMKERPEKRRLRDSERACDKERARGPEIQQIPQEMREVKHAWTPPLKNWKNLKKVTAPGIPKPSPIQVLTRPCVACLRRADGMRSFQRGMAVTMSSRIRFAVLSCA